MKHQKKLYIIAATAATVIASAILTGCGAQTETGQKVEQDTSPVPAITAAAAKLPTLTLPDSYSIQYQIHKDGGEPEDYTMSMTKTAEGVYLDYGDTGDQNVLFQMENGKYLICEYEPNSGMCHSSMLTQETQRLIDAGVMTLDMVTVGSTVADGYSTKMNALLTQHQTYAEQMEYLGDEAVGEIICQKYVVYQKGGLGTQENYFWIDPELGLCRKALYQNQFLNASPEISTVECVLFETENLFLPEFYLVHDSGND